METEDALENPTKVGAEGARFARVKELNLSGKQTETLHPFPPKMGGSSCLFFFRMTVMVIFYCIDCQAV